MCKRRPHHCPFVHSPQCVHCVYCAFVLRCSPLCSAPSLPLPAPSPLYSAGTLHCTNPVHQPGVLPRRMGISADHDVTSRTGPPGPPAKMGGTRKMRSAISKYDLRTKREADRPKIVKENCSTEIPQCNSADVLTGPCNVPGSGPVDVVCQRSSHKTGRAVSTDNRWESSCKWKVTLPPPGGCRRPVCRTLCVGIPGIGRQRHGLVYVMCFCGFCRSILPGPAFGFGAAG